MKRVILILTAIALCMSAAATAEDNVCPHTNIYEWIEGMVYEKWSSINHKVIYGVNVECEDCGTWLDWYGEGYFEAHDFSGNVCLYCEYNRVADLPTPEALQQQALQRITEDPDGIAGKTATVIHNGNLRAKTDQNSTDLGAVVKGEEYEILSYLIVENQFVWLEVKYNIGSAWISASLVEISGKNTVDDSYADYYIGQMCTIKVSSGRARLAPDKDAPVVGYVHYWEKYKILDCQAADDGTLWFQIKVDNQEGWISSGLADVN